MRTMALGLGLVTAGALLTGCGGSSEPAAAGAAASTISSAVAAASSAAAAVSSAPASVAAGNPDSDFCTKARDEQTEQARDLAAFTTDTPAQLKTFADEALAQVPEFESSAPAEIKSDVTTVAEADKKIFTSLAAAGYDYTKLPPSVLTSFSTPALSAASTRIAAYLAKTCGIAAATSVP